jgi:transcriptional regulator of aroF, aroG, tyrA and aromatic amino acid transport
LQDGHIRRIGGFEEIPVNARIITATNKNLHEMVQVKKFREDLFYRINVLTILIPPLKERLMDIPLLAGSFLRQFNLKLGKAEQAISREALARLYDYAWPGNVRELKNVVERAAVLSDTDVIGVEAILLGHETVGHGNRSSVGLPQGGSRSRSLKELIGRYETDILLDTLNTAKSIREAARRLGLSHTALLKKLEKYKLSSGNKNNQWNKTGP